MPRFQFHVYDGVDLPDDDGTELPSLHAARLQAVRFAGEILAQDHQRIALGEDWRMEVTDDQGLILFRLDFVVMETAATMSVRRPLSAGLPDLN